MLTGGGKDRSWLARTSYPGRGLVVGCSADGAAGVQLYWIMGRSSRSRNRRLVRDDSGAVRAVAAVPAAPAMAVPGGGDDSLIHYPATAVVAGGAPGGAPGGTGSGSTCHVIGNGDHVATIAAGLAAGDSFAAACARRDPEPDPPHYTPRIAGLIAAGGGGYELAIIKTAAGGDPRQVSFQHFTYRSARPGWGHCLATYEGAGEGGGAPLPPFAGEPFPLPLAATPRQAVRELWDLLDRGHRVAALAKFIDRSGAVTIALVNRHPDPAAAGGLAAGGAAGGAG